MKVNKILGGAIAILMLTLCLVPMASAQKAKPKIAVLEFGNKTAGQWWYHGGASAAQDVFVTELVRSKKYSVISRVQVNAALKRANLTLSGDVDPSTAVRVGKLLGVNYLLTGAVTEYGVTDKQATRGGGKKAFICSISSSLIDTSTGEVVWVHKATKSDVSVGGFGGGVDDERMFSKLMKPVILQLTASLKAADL